ncbi:hypothetical protein LAX5112_03301 [Roseibium alexandrii]|uniref:Uncharacterized protein n=1 Tax=Roseibium alexandrii TaxID=388408 RepID=A0A0M7ADU2_9HYPH|nr:hypothetical protein LAX5112_03301 [Roseibium alexandrii]
MKILKARFGKLEFVYDELVEFLIAIVGHFVSSGWDFSNTRRRHRSIDHCGRRP